MIENPIFISVSGSHLYGIPDPEDVDLRGAHAVSWEQFSDYRGRRDKPIEKTIGQVDLVSQEIGRFLALLVKPNVNFIEQVLSPLKIVTSKHHNNMKEIARDCISKACYSHWKGFAKHTSYHAVQEDYKKAKRNLYLLRIYYQALYVIKNGKIRSDFDSFRNIEEFNDDMVTELFDCKKRKAPFHNKQNFLAHCGELEKILAQKLEKSDMRDAPLPEAKDGSNWLYGEIMRGLK